MLLWQLLAHPPSHNKRRKTPEKNNACFFGCTGFSEMEKSRVAHCPANARLCKIKKITGIWFFIFTNFSFPSLGWAIPFLSVFLIQRGWSERNKWTNIRMEDNLLFSKGWTFELWCQQTGDWTLEGGKKCLHIESTVSRVVYSLQSCRESGVLSTVQ